MNIKKEEIDLIVGATTAYNYRKKNPTSSEEDVIAHIISFSKESKQEGSQLIFIMGASFALKILETDRNSSEKEIADSLMKRRAEILSKKD